MVRFGLRVFFIDLVRIRDQKYLELHYLIYFL